MNKLQSKFPDKKIQCYYHDDDYFTGEEFNELYMITFSVESDNGTVVKEPVKIEEKIPIEIEQPKI